MILAFWSLGLVMIGVAIPLMKRKVPRNHFYGMRTRETLKSDAVWYEANAYAGKYLLWIGIGTILVSSSLFTLPWRNMDHYAYVCLGLLFVNFVQLFIRSSMVAKRAAENANVVAAEVAQPARRG